MTTDVLLIYPRLSSFVERDFQIIKEKFSVRTFAYTHRRQLLRLITNGVRSRLAIAWFALGYAYPLVRMYERMVKPSIIIAGGYDVEACPEINYGAMLLEKRRERTSYALSHASRVLAVSRFTMGRVKHWAPAASIEVLYHGFEECAVQQPQAREVRVATVADVSAHTWRLKGLSEFIGAARLLPSVPFVVAGRIHENASNLVRKFPPNVRLTGWLERGELYRLLMSSAVYAQLSYVESFGCALAEAMSCGCFPVVTDRGALPEVVGRAGTLVPYGDVAAAAEAIRAGLENKRCDDAIRRVRDQFSLSSRRNRLLEIMEGLLRDGR